MSGIPSKYVYKLTEVGQLLDERLQKRMENVIYSVGKYSSELIRNYEIESTKQKLQTELADTFDAFLNPGNNTLVVAKLKFDHQSHFIFKLFDISLLELIMHYLSLKEFQNRINNNIYIEGYHLNLDISYLFLLGFYRDNGKIIPFIIQEYNEGIGYKDLRYTIPSFSNQIFTILFRIISSQGFVIDPSPMNWIFEINTTVLKNMSMTYIDLLYFNDPVTKNEAVNLTKELLKQPMD